MARRKSSDLEGIIVLLGVIIYAVGMIVKLIIWILNGILKLLAGKEEQEVKTVKEYKAYFKVKLPKRSKTNKEDKNELTAELIEKYNLGNVEEKSTHDNFKFSVELAKKIAHQYDIYEEKYITKKISVADINSFLFSGKFNSVLGPEGFTSFKNELKKIVDEINKGTNKDNFINLDDFFQVLLHSGVYYEDEYLPKDIKTDEKEKGWLTAYRFISKNFPDITYVGFRTITKNIKKTDGNTIEFDKKDKSSALYKKLVASGLFTEDVSVESILSTLSMKELRDISSSFSMVSKRTKDDTVKELSKHTDIEKYCKDKYSNKSEGLVFCVKDEDLVTGKDIIYLDKYLRDIAKHIRNDLFEFVRDKQKFEYSEVII